MHFVADVTCGACGTLCVLCTLTAAEPRQFVLTLARMVYACYVCRQFSLSDMLRSHMILKQLNATSLLVKNNVTLGMFCDMYVDSGRVIKSTRDYQNVN